jgi:hypothetical protein
MRILIVEGEADLAEALAKHLRSQNAQIRWHVQGRRPNRQDRHLEQVRGPAGAILQRRPGRSFQQAVQPQPLRRTSTMNPTNASAYWERLMDKDHK